MDEEILTVEREGVVLLREERSKLLES